MKVSIMNKKEQIKHEKFYYGLIAGIIVGILFGGFIKFLVILAVVVILVGFVAYVLLGNKD